MNKHYWEILWETHCNTVWDFFRNPHVLRFLRKWYRKKYEGKIKEWEKLKIFSNNTTKKDFSNELYRFVLNIFQDEHDFQEFMLFIRNELWTDIENTDIKNKYHTGKITTAIFAFKEVLDQLWYANSAGINLGIDSLRNIFATQIITVLEKAHEHIVSKEHEFHNFAWVEKVMEYGFIPISTNWEILTFLHETEYGIMVTALKGWDSFELLYSDIENIDVSRKEILLRIREINNIISYNNGEKNKLSIEEALFQDQLLEDFEKEWESWTFWDFLQTILHQLISQVPRLSSEDTPHKQTMIKKWALNQDGKPCLRVIIGWDRSGEKRMFPLRVIKTV